MAEAIKIGIVGAGAVGGVISAMLAEKGYDVELARRHKSQINLGNCVGLEVVGEFGNRMILVPSVPGADAFTSKKDIIFILTRAQDAPDCLRKSCQFLKTNGVFVCVQNVMNIDEISQIIPIEKVVGLVIDWMAVRHNMGKMEVLKKGGMKIGMYNKLDNPLLDAVQQMLSEISPTAVTNNILGTVYSRTVMNSCVSSMSAMSGLTIGGVLKQDPSKKIMERIVKEAVDVAKRLNLKIEPFDSVLDYYKFSEKGLSAKIYRGKMIRRIIKNNEYVTPSDLAAIEKKQKTEVDYLNGYIVKVARRIDSIAPVNERTYSIVKEIEEGKRTCNIENLEDYYLNHPNKYVYQKAKGEI